MSRPRIFVPRAVVPEAMELLRTRCDVEVGSEGGLTHEELVKAVRGYDGIFLRFSDKLQDRGFARGLGQMKIRLGLLTNLCFCSSHVYGREQGEKVMSFD